MSRPVHLLRSLLVFGLLCYAKLARADGLLEDYERSAKLAEATRDKVFRTFVSPEWLEGGTRFWYRNELPKGEREYIYVDAEKGIRSLAFDHVKLAAALSKQQKGLHPEKLDLAILQYDAVGKTVRIQSQGQAFDVSLVDYVLQPARDRTKRAPAPSTVVVLPKVQPSRRTGEETSLAILNRTAKPIELFWVDSSGNRKSYGKVPPGEERRQHTFAGHVWIILDADQKTLAVVEAIEGGGTATVTENGVSNARKKTSEKSSVRPPVGDRSPDGRWQAFFKDFNLHVRDSKSGQELILSKDGSEADAYQGSVYWSPDSKKVVALRVTKGEERKVHMVESSPKDSIYPKLHTISYAKPGDKLTVAKPHLFHVVEPKEISIPDLLFAQPWSLDRIRWDVDSQEFSFVYNQRGHQILRVVAVDGNTGKARAVVDEVSKTFVDYNGKFFFHDLPADSESIWMSERDGWNHLYLFDRKTGKVKNAITKGDWLVRGVDRVDEENRQIWFRAGGLHPGQDPYHVHFCRINFDGTGLVKLTEGDGSHSIRYSPDGKYLIDTYSRVDLPPVTELRRTDDGSLVCVLEQADMSALLKTGWQVPERFVAKGRDGTTDIHGVIYRPTKFDATKKYPVIEYIYAGPHSSFVPKTFRNFHGPQALAELGFILVQIDGMGTSNRSKAFHDVCWKNLGDSGFPDRILWIRAAAAKYPQMDLRRVGIYGGSAGGQSALRALLAHGDFYHVAVADCGCHDNRVDKIWWNELWMGYPIGPHYAAQSNATNAHKLRGKLLLTVGELDRNVDPASTMQVANALIKAGKDFELLIFPGAGHGAGESTYGSRRRKDFFVRHLLGTAPPDWNALPQER